MNTFSWPVRVYYEDTDAGGVVYYANYLRFLERARTEYLRSLGFEQDSLRAQEGLGFVVKHVDIDYRSPARFNEQLQVDAKITAVGRSSITFSQQVLRSDTCLASATVVVVCLDLEQFRLRSIPPFIREAFQRVS